jgi:hypothetical protein
MINSSQTKALRANIKKEHLDSALFIYVLFDSVRIILPQESRPCILQPESGFSDMDQADR